MDGQEPPRPKRDDSGRHGCAAGHDSPDKHDSPEHDSPDKHDRPDKHDGSGAHRDHHGHKRRQKRGGNIGNGTSEDMILLATSLATQIARGKTECELETLINVLDILQDVMISILAQRRICNRQALEILQGGNDVIISR